MKKELIVFQDPKSPISEIFRTLRTNIQFMNTKNSLKTILVTSTLPGEGKSWVSSNLAVGFAQTGKKVILIDADMRKGRQYSIFGVSPRPGLSNYLSGVGATEDGESSEDIVDYIQTTDVPNLYLMVAGNIPPNPSELLISPQMVALIEELKEVCDIIIIDGTPSQLVTDSLILTRLVDSTIIVAASKQTKKDDLQRIVNNIKNVGGKIAGVVLNKIPVSAKRYQQAYYYGGNQNSNKNRKPVDRNAFSNFMSKPTPKKEETVSKVLQEEKKEVKEPIKKEENINIQMHGTETISQEKTDDILRQINDYLDTEKKNLK